MKVQWGILVGGASGSAGDTTIANWKGIAYARRRVIPANPQSAAQTSQRDAFKRCVYCYQGLPQDVQDFLDKLGGDRQQSGFNVMMSASVKDERASHGHIIVPANRYAPPLNGFQAATGVGASGDIDLTWDADDWLATDVGDVYHREKEAEGDEFQTPWVQADTAALDMSTGAFTLSGLEAGTDYQVAMVPYHTVNEAFGCGAFAPATSMA